MVQQENYMCSWTDHSNYFFSSISSLRLNEILTDVTITCGDKYFQAHKLVLCASSEYFRSILANNIEKLAIVHIVGVPPVYIHNILQYLYTGQIEITPTDVEPFLRVANDLKICGLFRDDGQFMSISEPDPDPDPEPAVDPVEQHESSYNNLNSSVPFIPQMDPTLMPRFKNPIPLDELRLKKKIRGSEPTLGNSLPQNIVESRNSSEDKPMEQTDGHMEHSAAAAALNSLANAAVNAAKEEATVNGHNSREEITIVPDIVDLREENEDNPNKENRSSHSSRGPSPNSGHSPNPGLNLTTAALFGRSSPGVSVTAGGSSASIFTMSGGERPSLQNIGAPATSPNTTTSAFPSMSQFTIRPNAHAIDPASAAAISTRSANKRKSMPTKLDTSGGLDKKNRMESHSPYIPSAMQMPTTSTPSLFPMTTSEATIVPMSSSSASPFTSLTTSSLNSPYLRSSSNPCKGLTPLNCRKGHNGSHCNHMIIPLPDGRKAHYSKQEYEAWLKTN